MSLGSQVVYEQPGEAMTTEELGEFADYAYNAAIPIEDRIKFLSQLATDKEVELDFKKQQSSNMD